MDSKKFNRSMTRPRAATSHLAMLAKTIAVPADHPPQRLPTFPNIERTAVLSFLDTTSVVVDSPDASNNATVAVLTRDPAYPLWFGEDRSDSHSVYACGDKDATTYDNPDATNVMKLPYNISFGVMSAGTYGARTRYNTPLLRNDGNYFGLLGGPMLNNNTGTVAPVGVYSIAFELICSYTGTAPTFTDASMQVEYIDAYGNIGTRWYVTSVADRYAGFTTTTITGGTGKLYYGGVVAAQDSWIAVRPLQFKVELGIANDTVASIDNLFGGITTSPKSAIGAEKPLTTPIVATFAIRRLFPVGTPPEMPEVGLIWNSVRSTAASALFTNVTKVTDKEGTISAARVPITNGALAPRDWNGFAAFHPDDRYFGAMEKGLYTYALPDTGSESFRDSMYLLLDESSTTNTFVMGGLLNFEGLAYGNCVQFKDLGGESSTLALTVARHIEFRTTSRLFPSRVSPRAIEEYHSSQVALTKIGVFFENPVHLSAIATLAQQAAQTVWPMVRPMVASLAERGVRAAARWASNKIRGDMSQAAYQPAKSSPPKMVGARRRARTTSQRRSRRTSRK